MNSEVSSFSTEPEAGTLSQSEYEIAVEGKLANAFFTSSKPTKESDAQSDISDLHSLSSSKIFKTKDNRRANLSTISALKNENLMLKAALDKANMIDISSVQTKLRVTNNDLILYKQYNSELKDRVQELESRLFEALRQQKSSTYSKEVVADRNQNEKIRSLLSKNDHLSRLLKSYERRIANMQAEIDSFRVTANSFIEEDTAIHIPLSYEDKNYGATKRDDHQSGTASSQIPFASLTPEVQALVREQAAALARKSREADRKTIGELAREVKRLTALLPRRLRSTDTDTSGADGVSSADGAPQQQQVTSENSAIDSRDSSLRDDRIVSTTFADPPADAVRASIVKHVGTSSIVDRESDGEAKLSSRSKDLDEQEERDEVGAVAGGRPPTDLRRKTFSLSFICWTLLRLLLAIALLIILTLIGLVVILG